MRITEVIELSLREDEKIRGAFHFATVFPSSPAVIFAHGLGSTRQGEKIMALEAECAQRGWAFAAFDFRGHGESTGRMQELRGSQLLEDLDAITRFVAERGHESIFLFGSSMGGWAAAWFASLHPERIAACALIAPAFRFLEWRRLTEAERTQWRQTGRLRVTNQWIDLELGLGLLDEAAQFPFETLTQRFQTPGLLIHGLLDDTVPYTNSLEFIEQCGAADVQLLLIKNGDHRLNTQKETIARLACDFFQQRL